jgi:hypothetical protein
MRFDIVWDPAKIARIQKRLEDRDRQQVTSRGALVRDEMPALPNVFPQLSRILDGAAWREHLRPVVFLAVRSQSMACRRRIRSPARHYRARVTWAAENVRLDIPGVRHTR